MFSLVIFVLSVISTRYQLVGELLKVDFVNHTIISHVPKNPYCKRQLRKFSWKIFDACPFDKNRIKNRKSFIFARESRRIFLKKCHF